MNGTSSYLLATPILTRADAVRALRGLYRHAVPLAQGEAANVAVWNTIAALENALAQDDPKEFAEYVRDAVEEAAKIA